MRVALQKVYAVNNPDTIAFASGFCDMIKQSKPPQDANWLAALRAGDEFAWRSFVEQYSHRIYRFFRNAAPASADVEQLSSQAMQSIFQQLPAFRGEWGEASIASWVYTICRGILVDAHRHRGRWREFISQFAPQHWLQATPDPESALVQKNEISQMHQAMRSLPLKYKEVLTLRYIEEYSIQDVASILDLSPDLVKNRARLGKQYLRKAMQRHAQPSSLPAFAVASDKKRSEDSRT